MRYYNIFLKKDGNILAEKKVYAKNSTNAVSSALEQLHIEKAYTTFQFDEIRCHIS